MRSVAAVLIALALAGCAALRPPTHVVALPANEWGEFALDVYDSTGLVTGGRSLEPALAMPGSPTAAARPDAAEVDVSWTGGACDHRPILNVRGTEADLKLELVPAPVNISLAPVQCPAVGLGFAVTLTLAEPVEQSGLTLTELR